MNYYERHIGDYLKDTTHLSLLEHGVYSRLLDVYYTREAELPLDVAVIARLIGARSKDEKEAVASVLDEFFPRGDDGWSQDRADREIARFKNKQDKAKRSADARWHPDTQHTDRNANAMRTHSEGNALQSPVTSNQSPVTISIHSEPKGSGDKSPKLTDPQEIIFGYGLSLLVSASTPEKQARSFLGGLRKEHGDAALIDKLRECAKAKPLQPLEWLAAALPPRSAPGRPNAQEALEASNRAVAARFLEKDHAIQ